MGPYYDLSEVVSDIALKPMRPCNHIGCPELIRDGRYCEKHAKEKSKQYESGRKGTKERDFYNSAQWQRIRDLKRKRDPLCEVCLREGRVVIADLVHHNIEVKQDWSRRFDMGVLESVCTACHEKIHQRFNK